MRHDHDYRAKWDGTEYRVVCACGKDAGLVDFTRFDMLIGRASLPSSPEPRPLGTEPARPEGPALLGSRAGAGASPQAPTLDAGSGTGARRATALSIRFLSDYDQSQDRFVNMFHLAIKPVEHALFGGPLASQPPIVDTERTS